MSRAEKIIDCVLSHLSVFVLSCLTMRLYGTDLDPDPKSTMWLLWVVTSIHRHQYSIQYFSNNLIAYVVVRLIWLINISYVSLGKQSYFSHRRATYSSGSSSSRFSYYICHLCGLISLWYSKQPLCSGKFRAIPCTHMYLFYALPSL